MKKIISLLFLLSLLNFSEAQIPNGYYDAAAGLNGLPLKIALHNIIKNHNVIPYSSLFSVFPNTDSKGNNIVWDIYSDNPYGNPPYVFYYTNPSDQCGQYSQEGDCYNKEHSWPHSWFNSTSIPVYSDLFNVYPTDGWVNNKRANYPYGEINNPSWTSQNGSKLGSCSYPGYTSTVFEPIDEYKGDIARSYFYIIVRYYGEDGSWPGSAQTIGADLKAWAYNMMYEWHTNDPVSQKETDRNNAIYLLQNNRNPFIDHPEWVDSILNPVGLIKINSLINNLMIYPNPTTEEINISYTEPIHEIVLYDAIGKECMALKNNDTDHLNLDLSLLEKGYYLLQIKSGNSILLHKIIKY